MLNYDEIRLCEGDTSVFFHDHAPYEPNFPCCDALHFGPINEEAENTMEMSGLILGYHGQSNYR